MPGQASLVEQVNAQRVERQQNDEQEERQLDDYRHHACGVFQSIVRVLCKQGGERETSQENVQMGAAFESGKPVRRATR